MEITIVEPCPECGTVPNKFTATQEENDCAPRVYIQCPQCGWTSWYEHTNPSMVLSKWNDRASNRRIEKTAKPCPFCGSSELKIEMNSDLSWSVGCQECEGHSGTHDTKQEALEAWNRRPDSE